MEKNMREREELHKAIWSIADDLRGSVDGWDFKQYILGIMFYRYISENITNYINDGSCSGWEMKIKFVLESWIRKPISRRVAQVRSRVAITLRRVSSK